MNRRNFFMVAPLGIAGIASLTKTQEPKNIPSDIVATEGLVITKDGKKYNVLAVSENSAQVAKLETNPSGGFNPRFTFNF